MKTSNTIVCDIFLDKSFEQNEIMQKSSKRFELSANNKFIIVLTQFVLLGDIDILTHKALFYQE